MNRLNLWVFAGCMALMAVFAACGDDDASLDDATLRSLKHQQELRDKLTGQLQGWKVLYFPQADSLLFSDLNRNIREYDYDPEDMGYGGKMFLMRFTPDGRVTMTADDSPSTCSEPKTSEYRVKQGMMTQLSFTTFTYLHSLVNSRFCGTGDFYYKETDMDGNACFTSGNYMEPMRELILFEPLDTLPADGLLERACANRLFFEQMRNPQISIRQGDRIFFRSDYPIKTPARAEGMREHRYAVFLYEKVESPTGEFPKEVQALGSGYTGTDDGLKFFPGIRLNSKYVFSDFEREGDRFRCELVRVYAPKYQKFFYGSKHRYPQGEYTGMVAVIADEPR